MESQSSLSLQKKHFVEIDYLRCFAILAVIAIHTAAALTRVENSADFFVVSLWQDISSFAVPLFITISGFVLCLSYNPDEKGLFYRKRFQRILPPYLIFTVVYLVANIFKSSVVTGIYNIPSIGDIINAFLFATSNEHMWFFLIIIELYLFYPIIFALYHKFAENHRDWVLLVVCLIVQVLWNSFSGVLSIFVNGETIFLNNKIFLCMIFYFILGMFLSRHYDSICAYLDSGIALVILTIGTALTAFLAFTPLFGSYYGFSPLSYCVLVILLLFAVSRRLVSLSQNNIFTTIGFYSFGIYLIHPLIQGLFGFVIYPAFTVTPETWVYYPAVFFTTIILSVVSVYLIKKLPYNRYIIG